MKIKSFALPTFAVLLVLSTLAGYPLTLILFVAFHLWRLHWRKHTPWQHLPTLVFGLQAVWLTLQPLTRGVPMVELLQQCTLAVPWWMLIVASWFLSQLPVRQKAS